MVEPGKPLNFVAMRSLCEVRSLVCTEIARLAALRIKAPEIKELAGLVGRMKLCVQEGEGDFQSLDFEFHYTLAKASENVAFLLMLNSIREVYLPMTQAFSAMFEHVLGDPGVYEEIYEAVKGGDSPKVGNLTHQLIEEGNRIFLELHEDA